VDDGVVQGDGSSCHRFYTARRVVHDICRYWGKLKMHVTNSRAATTRNNNKYSEQNDIPENDKQIISYKN